MKNEGFKDIKLKTGKVFLIQILLFLIILFPMVLQVWKGVIFSLIMFIVFFEFSERKKVFIHSTIAKLIFISIFTNLFFLLRGTINNPDIFWMHFPVRVIWPAVYTVVLIGAFSDFKKIDLSKLLVSTTILISFFILYVILNFMGHLPHTFLLNLPLNYVVNNDFGFISLFMPNITSLFFLVPYNISLLLNYEKGVAVKKRYIWIAIIISTLSAIIIGRRALLIVIVMSFFLNFFLIVIKEKKLIKTYQSSFNNILKSLNKRMFILMSVILFISVAFVALFQSEALRLGNFDTELLVSSDAHRPYQFWALMEGWLKNPILGAGFGVSTRLIQSGIPGFYELTYVATLFQTGLVGVVIYIFLLIFLLRRFIVSMRSNRESLVYLIPVFTGMCAVLVANATNPYLASFDSLWALFYPLAVLNSSIINHERVKDDSNAMFCYDQPEVAILMATYNGEKYIRDQLDSILNQTYDNWKLFIRDDGSIDNTLGIVEAYAKKDKRIYIIKDSLGNLSQCLNFNELMKHSTDYSYIMFADQDDIWKEMKVEVSINTIKNMERSHTASVPILVYTNYDTANSDLEKRKIAYGIHHSNKHIGIVNRLLVQPWIMGCTMIINNTLLLSSLEVPVEADNHDNWISLIAAIKGKVGYLDIATMVHRIHSKNVTQRKSTKKLKNRFNRTIIRFKMNSQLIDKRIALIKELEKKIIYSENDILSKYKRLLKMGGFQAIAYAYRNNFFATCKLQTSLFYAQLVAKKK